MTNDSLATRRLTNRRPMRSGAGLQTWQTPPYGTSASRIPYDEAPLLTRLAAAPDDFQLAALVRRATLAVPGSRESPLAHPQRCDLMGEQLAAGRVMLAERGAQVLGFAAIRARDDGNLDIGALFVELDRWRVAVASLLVAHCIDRARVLGARSLHVRGTPRAERFYLDCGFELTGLELTSAGVAQILRMPMTRT